MMDINVLKDLEAQKKITEQRKLNDLKGPPDALEVAKTLFGVSKRYYNEGRMELFDTDDGVYARLFVQTIHAVPIEQKHMLKCNTCYTTANGVRKGAFVQEKIFKWGVDEIPAKCRPISFLPPKKYMKTTAYLY